MNKNLGKIIKQLRIEAGLSQPELAKKLEVSNAVISFWENNINEPKASYIIKISQIFNVTTDYLLGLENEDGTKTENFEEQPIQLSARSKDNKIKEFTLTQKQLEEIIANAIKINKLK